ncbi:Hypothetical protein D9617_23g005670 [Elsinoe fawcettii]|nr:Hypothetical protein D9617_23g005670 [Elsinoe fawcettii]
MAPGNYNYNNYLPGYDNRQQNNNSSYGYANSVNNNPQYESSSTATFQPNTYQQSNTAQSNSTNAAYGRQWAFQPSRNDNRAAETLSSLSAQEPAAYGSGTMNSGSGYGSGAWETTPQRAPSTVAQSASSVQSYDSGYTRATQATYSTSATSQSDNYGDSSYQQNGQNSAAFQYPRTSQPYNPGNENRARSTAGQTGYNKQSATASPRLQQSGRLSPAVSQTQTSATYQTQRPSTSGHNRVQSVTPTQLQQPPRNAPPPQAAAPAQATIDPTQVYDPWPEQKRAAEKAAEDRKRREAEQATKRAADEAAERERKRQEEVKAAAEHEKERGMAQAKALTSALDAAMNAADASGTSHTDATEAEMRAMFAKMREFNAANPRLLAKLWEEEHQAHVTKLPSQQGNTPAPAPQIRTYVATTPSAPSPAPTSAQTKKSAGKKAGVASKADSTPKVPRPSKSKKEKINQEPTSSTASPVPAQAAANDETVSKNNSTSTATASVTSPASATSASGTSIWPPGRKQLLAETGSKWLNERKENSGKHISAAKLAELLNGNPSYPNLCASIEAMGIFLDRSAFARTLLTAVPDLNKPAQQVGVSAQSSVVPTAPPATFGAQMVSTSAQPTMSAYSGPAPEAPMVNGAYRPQQPSASPAPVVKPPPPRSATLNKLNSLSRPLTKEENARKRVFDELENLDDSEDEMPPPKVQNIGGQFGEFSSALASPPIDGQMLQQMPPHQFDSKSVPSKSGNTRLAELRNQILVQPLKREKAARRSTYDPRTIARDVLLATGRHPEMRPLNGHLMRLQGLLATHADNVEGHKYDLSTMRWDLIDPGEPLPDSEDDKSDNGSEADDESDSLSTSALARPALSAPRTLDHGDGTMTMTSVTMQPTLKGHGKIKRRGRPPRNSAPGGMISLSGGDNGNNGHRNGQQTSTPQPRKQAAGPPGSAPSNTNRTGTPSGGTPSANVSGYAAFRAAVPVQIDENGNPVKRRGRPVGWRKAIHSKEAQGLGSSGPSTQRPKSNVPSEMKKRGRPSQKRPDEEERAPSPHYNIYHCRWEDCRAELHNLDTLRKHVLKIHGAPIPNIYACRWRSCNTSRSTTTDTKGKAPASRHEFLSINSWMSHIEKTHLLPLAQTLGDGPRSGLSDAYDSETSQAYLSDASGRIITPRATPLADVAEEDERQADNLAPILRRGMPRVRGVLSQEQKDDEYKLQQLEAKKLLLGPVWDKGGASLANNKRRRGFYDDEDFEEEGEADDGPEWDA